MGYLETFGPRADPATELTWGLIVISVVVALVVAALVTSGVVLRHSRAGPANRPPPTVGGSGLGWFYVGLPLTVLALLVALVWTVRVLAQINSPSAKPALTLVVTAQQWWWEVTYLGATPAETFTTANEIHIPTAEPVLVRLASADAVHSFWVPALTGKTETIPGRLNVAWLQADKPGLYRGQCTEYCGVQHAHMALYVVAQAPADFAVWRAGQLTNATAPAGGEATTGAALFVARCGVCHAVRGS